MIRRRYANAMVRGESDSQNDVQRKLARPLKEPCKALKTICVKLLGNQARHKLAPRHNEDDCVKPVRRKLREVARHFSAIEGVPEIERPRTAEVMRGADVFFEA